MTIKEEINIIKTECGRIALGNGNCWICNCKSAKRGMTIHHLWYLKKDIIYNDYPKNDSGTLEYYKDLLPMIKKNPKRFMYLCNTHHFALEKFCRFGDKIYNKMSIARKMTKT